MHAALAIIVMNLSALRTRLGSSAVVVIAILALAGISTAMLSIATGWTDSRESTVSNTRVILSTAGALAEAQSNVSRDTAVKIESFPGVQRGRNGKALVAREIFSLIPMTERATNHLHFLMLRGTTAEIFELRPEYKIVEGRMFQPGLHELIVGKEPHDLLLDLDVGQKVVMPDGEWTIVGVFDGPGRGQWTLYGDIDTVAPSLHKTTYNSVIVRLDKADSFEPFNAALKSDPTVTEQVEREADYFERTEGPRTHFYETIGLVVGGIVGLGVVFASANMMYAAVSRRILEIATLRALGFGTFAVISSVLAESLVLAAIGAAIGIFTAWATCDGVLYVGGGFRLAVTAKLALASAGATLGVGVVAALFPAIRAARMPITTALQAR